jgi:hypothetical protein
MTVIVNFITIQPILPYLYVVVLLFIRRRRLGFGRYLPESGQKRKSK